MSCRVTCGFRGRVVGTRTNRGLRANSSWWSPNSSGRTTSFGTGKTWSTRAPRPNGPVWQGGCPRVWRATPTHITHSRVSDHTHFSIRCTWFAMSSKWRVICLSDSGARDSINLSFTVRSDKHGTSTRPSVIFAARRGLSVRNWCWRSFYNKIPEQISAENWPWHITLLIY